MTFVNGLSLLIRAILSAALIIGIWRGDRLAINLTLTAVIAAEFSDEVLRLIMLHRRNKADSARSLNFLHINKL